ncbi:hypothetical protein OG21DRAFT_1503594 [Imleria badia]|nr:hypothetical protein OG21DRAFT_1503594 [Imleria badia]
MASSEFPGDCDRCGSTNHKMNVCYSIVTTTPIQTPILTGSCHSRNVRPSGAYTNM